MIGDLHNGGQAVRGQRAPDGQFWFEKPRTVFWEKLFFGVDSPLRSFWSQSSALFQLIIERNVNDSAGRSQMISPTQTSSSEAFFNFGYLLGYSYLFGIQDLFRENVVRTATGVLPIDVEIVFSKFFLPHESALLPFKNIGWDGCALGLLADNRESVSIKEIAQILAGYARVLRDAEALQLQLLGTLAQLPLQTIPIRVLLRATAAYANGAAPTTTFLREEREQLARGDIPYFFKFVGDDSVYYHADGGVRTIQSELPEQMRSGLQNIGVHPRELLSSERITGSLLPTGSLYLLRALSHIEFRGVIELDSLTADVAESSITLTIESSTYSCRR